MFSVFAYLTLASVRNRLVRQVRRLRSPRYAIALVLGGLYFYAVFFRGGARDVFANALGETAATLWPLVLAVLASRWWLFGGDELALAFTPAEIQFLFPAPVARRSLIHFKLLRAQLAILASTIVWVVLLRGGGVQLSSWLRALALWVLFSTLHLHRLAASLVHASAARHGVAGARRNAIPIALFGAAGAALLWSLSRGMPGLRAAAGPLELLGALADLLRGPVPSAVLLPFRVVTAPTFAHDAGPWVRAIVPALAVMAAHYVWVVRTDALFEDAAIEASTKRAALIARRRARAGGTPSASGSVEAVVPTGRRTASGGAAVPRAWFPLAPTGHPAVALLWKNVIAATRPLRPRTFVFAALVGALVYAIIASATETTARGMRLAGTISFAWACTLVLFGPQMVRNDLRGDLPKLDLIRAYPLRGRTVVAAEVVSATLVLTAMQYALLGISAVTYAIGEPHRFGERSLTIGAAAFGFPLLNALTLTVQNATALLFPDWVRLGPERPGGVEAIGQNLLTTVASVFTLLIALILPTALGGGVGYALYVSVGVVAAVAAAAVLFAAVVVAELYAAVTWLGRVLEKTDPVRTG